MLSPCGTEVGEILHRPPAKKIMLTNAGPARISRRTFGLRNSQAIKPRDLAEVQKTLRRYPKLYNQRRPHQALNQAAPQTAWELLEHSPAAKPIPSVVLVAKAAVYLMKRRLIRIAVNRADTVVSKTGNVLEDFELQEEHGAVVESNQLLVEVTRGNC